MPVECCCFRCRCTADSALSGVEFIIQTRPGLTTYYLSPEFWLHFNYPPTMRGPFDKPRPASPKQPTHGALPPPIIHTAAAVPPITATRLCSLSREDLSYQPIRAAAVRERGAQQHAYLKTCGTNSNENDSCINAETMQTIGHGDL